MFTFPGLLNTTRLLASLLINIILSYFASILARLLRSLLVTKLLASPLVTKLKRMFYSQPSCRALQGCHTHTFAAGNCESPKYRFCTCKQAPLLASSTIVPTTYTRMSKSFPAENCGPAANDSHGCQIPNLTPPSHEHLASTVGRVK